MPRRTPAPTALVAGLLAGSLAAGAVAAAPVAAAPVAAAAASCQPGGAIGEHWQHLGGPRSLLGACLTGELGVPRGLVQHFQGGSVYWSPQTGPREVHGEIREAYERFGASGSLLGLPVTDETPTPSRAGAFTHFEGGSIYWSPTTGARVVHGSIRDAWAAQRWEDGPLGFPTSDEFATATGARSDFTGGSLAFTARTGRVEAGPRQAPYTAVVEPVTAARLGASYRSGCPVEPADLRLVRLTHLGFDGQGRTGELVVSARVADAVIRVFGRLYDARVAVERMRTVEAYGGSDDASMAANNTSAFNCRATTGGTGWSEHAYGEAVDLNPVQNPYVRGATVLPAAGRAFLDRSTPALGKARAGDAAVRAFAAEGWGWGGLWTSSRDYQHFSRSGR